METQEKQATDVRLSDEQVRAAALQWMNDLRAEYELSPLDSLPVARPGSTTQCVMAVGLADLKRGDGFLPDAGNRYQSGLSGAGRFRVMRDGEVHSHPIPEVVAEFMVRFDAKRYPDLVAADVHPGVGLV